MWKNHIHVLNGKLDVDKIVSLHAKTVRYNSKSLFFTTFIQNNQFKYTEKYLRTIV